jgi:hypothetical protein
MLVVTSSPTLLSVSTDYCGLECYYSELLETAKVPLKTSAASSTRQGSDMNPHP